MIGDDVCSNATRLAAKTLTTVCRACSVGIIDKEPGSSRLRINTEGLAVLRQMPAPIAPVVVIGPYRSGKSFLVNQMLNQSCGVSVCARYGPSMRSAAGDCSVSLIAQARYRYLSSPCSHVCVG
jgi:Guanylate-binding protein, N-terminal domain